MSINQWMIEWTICFSGPEQSPVFYLSRVALQQPTTCPATWPPTRPTRTLTPTSSGAFQTPRPWRTDRRCSTTTSPRSRCTSGRRPLPWLPSARTCWEASRLGISRCRSPTLQPPVVTPSCLFVFFFFVLLFESIKKHFRRTSSWRCVASVVATWLLFLRWITIVCKQKHWKELVSYFV